MQCVHLATHSHYQHHVQLGHFCSITLVHFWKYSISSFCKEIDYFSIPGGLSSTLPPGTFSTIYFFLKRKDLQSTECIYICLNGSLQFPVDTLRRPVPCSISDHVSDKKQALLLNNIETISRKKHYLARSYFQCGQ